MKEAKFFLIFFLLSVNLKAQQIKILKPKEIKFATPFSVIMEMDSNYLITSVSTISVETSDFEIIDVKIKGSKVILNTIAFNIGISTFPSITINTNIKDDIKTPPLPLEVKPLYNLKGNEQIRDIAPIFTFLWWLKVIILILIIVIIYFVWHKFKQKTINTNNLVVEADTRTPYERTMDLIKELLAKKLIEQNKTKEFYFELSDIIRRYIEEEFKIAATQMTSNEIIKRLKTDLPIEIIIKLREFLEISDLVKFAKYIPELEMINKNIEEVRLMVEKMNNFSKEKKVKEETKERLREKLKKEEKNDF